MKRYNEMITSPNTINRIIGAQECDSKYLPTLTLDSSPVVREVCARRVDDIVLIRRLLCDPNEKVRNVICNRLSCNSDIATEWANADNDERNDVLRIPRVVVSNSNMYGSIVTCARSPVLTFRIYALTMNPCPFLHIMMCDDSDWKVRLLIARDAREDIIRHMMRQDQHPLVRDELSKRQTSQHTEKNIV